MDNEAKLDKQELDMGNQNTSSIGQLHSQNLEPQSLNNNTVISSNESVMVETPMVSNESFEVSKTDTITSKKKSLLLFILVMVVLPVLIGGYFYYQSDIYTNKPNNDNSSSSENNGNENSHITFNDILHIEKRNEKYGIVDSKGNIIEDFIYKYEHNITIMYNGYYFLEEENSEGHILKRKGRILKIFSEPFSDFYKDETDQDAEYIYINISMKWSDLYVEKTYKAKNSSDLAYIHLENEETYEQRFIVYNVKNKNIISDYSPLWVNYMYSSTSSFSDFRKNDYYIVLVNKDYNKKVDGNANELKNYSATIFDINNLVEKFTIDYNLIGDQARLEADAEIRLNNERYIVVSKMYYDEDNGGSNWWYSGEKSGVYDINGKLIIPVKYDDIITTKYEWFIAYNNGKYGIIGTNEKILVPFEYDGIKLYENYLFVTKNQKLGIMDLNFNIVIDLKYDFVEAGFSFRPCCAGPETFIGLDLEDGIYIIEIVDGFNGDWNVIDKYTFDGKIMTKVPID